MADVKLVLIELGELIRAMKEAIKEARAEREADDWVDANSAPFGKRTFQRLARERAFPVSRVGKKHVARRSDIERYLETQRVAPQPSAQPCSNTSDEDPIARALEQGRLRIVKKVP